MTIGELHEMLENAWSDYGEDTPVHIWDHNGSNTDTFAVFGASYCKTQKKFILMDEQDYTWTCEQEGIIKSKVRFTEIK